MPTLSGFYNILNPGDTCWIKVGDDEYNDVAISSLPSLGPTGRFSIPDNSAGVPVLKINYDSTIPSNTLDMLVKQLGTNKEFVLECIGGQPTTPPWQKPKP